VPVVVAAAGAPLDDRLDAGEERPVGDGGGGGLIGGRRVVHDRLDCCPNLALEHLHVFLDALMCHESSELEGEEESEVVHESYSALHSTRPCKWA
jgi:hypothetical protein